MRLYFLATVSGLALNCSAYAADMPLKARPMLAPAQWTGWYAGVQGGIVDHDGKLLDVDGFLRGANGFGGQTYTASETGATFGGHLGYNWQRDRWVLGLEGDISGVWAKADANAPVPPAFAGSTVSFDVQWLATIRARAGVLITDATLLYATGGVAFGGVKNNGTLNQGIPFRMDQDTTKTGFVVGGGIEHMFGPRWTGRAEVRYVDLGSSSVTCPASTCPVGPYRGEFSNKLLMGLVGLSLKF
jgi:outer membrane immunogenic protein